MEAGCGPPALTWLGLSQQGDVGSIPSAALSIEVSPRRCLSSPGVPWESHIFRLSRVELKTPSLSLSHRPQKSSV